jgi:hypothetical protein
VGSLLPGRSAVRPSSCVFGLDGRRRVVAGLFCGAWPRPNTTIDGVAFSLDWFPKNNHISDSHASEGGRCHGKLRYRRAPPTH